MLFGILININSASSKSLVLSGALDHYKLSRNKMLLEFNMIIDLTNKEIEKANNISLDKKITKTSDILRILLSKEKILKNRQPKILNIIRQIENPPYSIEDDPEWISNNERDLLGASITYAKTDFYDSSYANTDCKAIKNFPAKKQFFLIAEIDDMSVIITKRGKNPGQEMCFLRLSDSSGSVDSVVLFPEDYINNKDLLQEGRVLMFNGQKNGQNNTVIIKKCFVV